MRAGILDEPRARRRISSPRSSVTARSPSARSRRCSRSTVRSSASRPRRPRRRGRRKPTRAERLGIPSPVGSFRRCRFGASPCSACTRRRSRSPGAGDGGGMNVYVRVAGSAPRARRRGVRRAHPRRPRRAAAGRRGRAGLPGRARRLPGRARRFRSTPFPSSSTRSPTPRSISLAAEHEPPDVLHANYWISGAVGAQAQARARPARWSRRSTRSTA